MGFNGVAIWGAGNDGKQLYERLKAQINVVCFIDSNLYGEMIDNVKVVSFSEFELLKQEEKMMILIGTSRYQDEVISELKQKFYRLGEDYLTKSLYGKYGLLFSILNYYDLRNCLGEKEVVEFIKEIKRLTKKKCVILYGNCHISPLTYSLLNHKGFRNDFIVLRLPGVHEYTSKKAVEMLSESFWDICDLFIGQRVNYGNRFDAKLATDIIDGYLSHSIQRIWIPFAYFNGYFPQLKHNDHNIHYQKGDYGLFPFGDKYVDSLKEEGMTNEEILEIISDPDYLNDDEINEYCDRSFRELKKRETRCTVTISDYIEENYKKRRLFYSPEHPIHEVILEETRRILVAIGYSDLTIGDEIDVKPLKGTDIPIYPSVQRILGLNQTYDDYLANSAMWDFSGDFVSFEKKYMETCWDNNIIQEDAGS